MKPFQFAQRTLLTIGVAIAPAATQAQQSSPHPISSSDFGLSRVTRDACVFVPTNPANPVKTAFAVTAPTVAAGFSFKPGDVLLDFGNVEDDKTGQTMAREVLVNGKNSRNMPDTSPLSVLSFILSSDLPAIAAELQKRCSLAQGKQALILRTRFVHNYG